MAAVVEGAFSTASVAVLATELTAFVAVEILSCNVAVALHPLIKAEDEGYFRANRDLDHQCKKPASASIREQQEHKNDSTI